MPRLTGYLQPEETGLSEPPMSCSHTLFSGTGPVGLPPVPWTDKQLKGRNIWPEAEVIAAVKTWLDGQNLQFFRVAYKS